MGVGAFAVPALEALAQSSASVLGVVTAPDKPQGRNRQPAPCPVKTCAQTLNLPLYDYQKEQRDACRAKIQSLAPDVLVVVDFGYLLPPSILALPRIAPVNIHPSLLPRHRGASPVPATILAGDTDTGVTLIRMNERMDAGDILMQTHVSLAGTEDSPDLEKRLSALGGEMIVRLLEEWASGKNVPARPQDEAQATYTRKWAKTDGKLDFSHPAQELERRVRAFRGWPGAYTFVRGKRLLVHRARAVGGRGEPGSVFDLGAGRMGVATREGVLEFVTVQLEGKNETEASEFLKGFPLRPGERFD